MGPQGGKREKPAGVALFRKRAAYSASGFLDSIDLFYEIKLLFVKAFLDDTA